MPRQRTYFHLLAVAIFTLLVETAQLREADWLQKIDTSAQDTLMRFGRRAKLDAGLVFLARDTASANLDATDLSRLFDLSSADPDSRRALELMAHEWPWSREVYALVLDRLMRAGARTVAFDFTFPKPSPEDELFRERLDRYSGKVVVAGNITEDLEGDALVFGAPTPTLVAPSTPRDSRIGYDNFWPDPDGVIRHTQYRWSLQSGVWQSGEELSLAARTLQKAGLGDRVPAGRQTFRMRLVGPPGTILPYSLHEIFIPKYWSQNYSNGTSFKDKIVVIGASGNWQHDEHQTALGMTTGAEIQINAINAALHQDYLRVLPWSYSLAICLFAGLVALFCCICWSSPLLHLGLLLLVAVLWSGAQVLLFDKPGLYLPIAGPLGILVLSGLFTLTYDLVSIAAERLRLRRTIVERKRVEEILQSANSELERRVEERTIALSTANASLTTLISEKDVLLKEVHHRVKNNLQTISSLLNLQSTNIKDPEDFLLFAETRDRVRSMSLVHEKLYQSHDLSRIDFADYLRNLTTGLAGSFSGKSSAVHIDVDADQIMLAVDSAVPCGLIVNELVTNCFKYAFAGTASGEIRIAMKRMEPALFTLSVSDNGVGFPKNVDFRNTESLGMQLVTTLTEQLEGTIALRNGCGTTFEISFPDSATPKDE